MKINILFFIFYQVKLCDMKYQYLEFYPEISNKKSSKINPAFLKYNTISSGRKLIAGGIKPDRVGFPDVI